MLTDAHGAILVPSGTTTDAMRLSRRKFLHLAAGAAALPALPRVASAQAQDFPARPVRIITHSAPGGSPDALLRIVADRLSQMWGQQVITLNHPGAGGAVAARTAAGVAADGYTLYMPCLLYTSPSPRDRQKSRMPSSA